MSFVSLINLGKDPIKNKDCIAEHIIGPILFHVVLKKPLLNPSGPGDLVLEIEKIASLISLFVNFWHI